MTDACSSSLVRSWGAVDSARCRTDLSPACLALLYTSSDALLDGTLAHWEVGYTRGALPRMACQAAGRCLEPR